MHRYILTASIAQGRTAKGYLNDAAFWLCRKEQSMARQPCAYKPKSLAAALISAN